jgi:hypothetical protein
MIWICDLSWYWRLFSIQFLLRGGAVDNQTIHSNFVANHYPLMLSVYVGFYGYQ